MVRVASLLAVVAAVGAGCSSERSGACTLIGCDDGKVSFSVIELADATPLANTTVEVCRNAACSRGTTPDRTGTSLALVGDLQAYASLWTSANGVALEVQIRPTGAYPYGLADGDVYRAEVRGADQTLSYSAVLNATYQESCPNGPDCDPCPCITPTLRRQ